MRSYKSESEFNITGRGKAFCVICDIEDSGELIGQNVSIDDKEYIVRNVERHCIPPGRDIGRTISLLVKEVN